MIFACFTIKTMIMVNKLTFHDCYNTCLLICVFQHCHSFKFHSWIMSLHQFEKKKYLLVICSLEFVDTKFVCLIWDNYISKYRETQFSEWNYMHEAHRRCFTVLHYQHQTAQSKYHFANIHVFSSSWFES